MHVQLLFHNVEMYRSHLVMLLWLQVYNIQVYINFKQVYEPSLFRDPSFFYTDTGNRAIYIVLVTKKLFSADGCQWSRSVIHVVHP